MKYSELIAILQANEDKLMDINQRAKELRLEAEAMYTKIRDIVRNTQFTSKDEYALAHREIERFNKRLFRRLGIDHDAF